MGRGRTGLAHRRSFRPLGRARFDDRSNVYSRRPSRSAQAVATAELGVSVPGTVAQPPFSMINRRSHHEALLNSVNFAGASACCWNLSTQIGASTSTTAVCARSFAIRSAVPPSVHPKIVKPSTDMTAAPMTTPQIPGFILGGKFIDLMSCAPVSAPLVHSGEISAVGARTIRATTYVKRSGGWARISFPWITPAPGRTCAKLSRDITARVRTLASRDTLTGADNAT
jgi:hypothetical protein